MKKKLMDTIDRDAYEPAYSQLANILKSQIANGVFRPGDQLPSEAQLCKLYNVSSMTVRRSINQLLDLDIVNTMQGKGTFVKPLELTSASFPLNQLQDIFGNFESTQAKFLSTYIEPASHAIAKKLETDYGDKIICIQRLLIHQGIPLSYHRAYWAYDPMLPVVEAEMGVKSLRGLFANDKNTTLKHGVLTIKPKLLDEEEAHHLSTDTPAAAFCLEHLFYNFDDRPISWGWFVFPADKLRLKTKMGIDISDF